jgi:hypothetical protein
VRKPALLLLDDQRDGPIAEAATYREPKTVATRARLRARLSAAVSPQGAR